MAPFLACLAFVLKIQTVAPVAAVHYLAWSFADWLDIIGFGNQVASVQESIATVEERQTLHFAFAGSDGLMQKDEIRRRQNFPKFMSRILIGAKSRIRVHGCLGMYASAKVQLWYAFEQKYVMSFLFGVAENHGVFDACAVLLTASGKDIETLLKSQCTVDMLEELNDTAEQV